MHYNTKIKTKLKYTVTRREMLVDKSALLFQSIMQIPLIVVQDRGDRETSWVKGDCPFLGNDSNEVPR